jgi:hypothetical protein
VHGRVVVVLRATSVNTSKRPLRAWIMELDRCCGMEVLRAQARFSAAETTKSFGITGRFVRYLCLKNTATEIQVAWVAVDQNFQH